MPKMKLEICVPVLTLAIGAVVGFLDASSHQELSG
jgi:putative methionine-R-sulfoxide reductase with GAF domain